MKKSLATRTKVKKTTPKKKITENFYSPIIIENINTEIDNGKFYAKAVIGDTFTVQADIFKEGHDVIEASLKYKKSSEKNFHETPMTFLENDLFEGSFVVNENAPYIYTIEAWVNPIATWLIEITKKCNASINVKNEIQEGILLLKELEDLYSEKQQIKLKKYILNLQKTEGAYAEVLKIIEKDDFKKITSIKPLNKFLSCYEKTLKLFVDRKLAEFSTWYEFFPRSIGTFKDCINFLPYVKTLGFNVVYLPPIHPIGITNRKGKNNSLICDPDDPGSPWGIGNLSGGHKEIHTELGAIEDFESFICEAKKLDIEVALDFAIQCSPDHPYVKDHPEWFNHQPDGTIKYAENPPKKYQDIYPINFYPEKPKDQEALFNELKSILIFWIEKGIKIFRVDNPHTKSLHFWKWLIDEIKDQYPEVIFLSEAFTRPKIMKYLAKAGFTQSYTYFTWRNEKEEIKNYLEELTKSKMKNYFKGNFFANTPDILTDILQKGGMPAFKMRYVLAATLSSSCGIYSGYELCENVSTGEGKEEYLHSEKYEIKKRDFAGENNIIDFISLVNKIRNENPSLQEYRNLEFYSSLNSKILCYGKRTKDNSNIIVVVVNLDPFKVHEDTITIPIEKFEIEELEKYQMKDLLTGEKYYWTGSSNYIKLDPNKQPAHIFKLKKQ